MSLGRPDDCRIAGQWTTVEIGITAFYEVPDTLEIDEYTIKLVDVLPYPTEIFDENNPLDESVYEVKLLVTKN